MKIKKEFPLMSIGGKIVKSIIYSSICVFDNYQGGVFDGIFY